MPTILFISEACLLDRKSGAAQSVRAQLKALARAGWQAHAVTLTLFDGDTDYPRALAHPALSPLPPAGSTVVLDDEGLAHTLYVTQSSRQRAARPWELQAFNALAQQVLDRVQPDMVLTYGSPLLQPLLAQAQQRGARTVFYVANASYARPDASAFRFVDSFVVPSQAMVALYRDKLGTDAQVVRSLVQAPLDGRRNLAPQRVAARKAQRFVTLINPDPAKGGQFFLNLVEQARVLAPGVRFRAVESRWGRADWAQHGLPSAVLDLVDWWPHTDDMGRVYEEAALLLVPSLGFEASGRVAVEALLAGVPVLAMRSGGLEEQLNGSGFLFDLPPALQVDHLAAPDKKDLHQWVHFIRVLMADDALYAQAVQLALQASALHEPARAQAAAVATYEAMARQPLLPGLAAQPGMQAPLQAKLQAQREHMNAAREAVRFNSTSFSTPSKALLVRPNSISMLALCAARSCSLVKDMRSLQRVILKKRWFCNDSHGPCVRPCCSAAWFEF